MSPRSSEHGHESASPLCDRGRARYHAPRHSDSSPRHLWNDAHKLFVRIKLCQNKLFFESVCQTKAKCNTSFCEHFKHRRRARAPGRRRRGRAGGGGAAPRARAGRSGARGARTKKNRAYTIVRTCICTYATCYYGLIAYESRATPRRRSRLFMGSPGRMCQRCAHIYHADADGTHPGRRATHAAAYLSFLGVMRRSTAEADRCRCIFAPVAWTFGSDATQDSASVLVIGSKRGA